MANLQTLRQYILSKVFYGRKKSSVKLQLWFIPSSFYSWVEQGLMVKLWAVESWGRSKTPKVPIPRSNWKKDLPSWWAEWPWSRSSCLFFFSRWIFFFAKPRWSATFVLFDWGDLFGTLILLDLVDNCNWERSTVVFSTSVLMCEYANKQSFSSRWSQLDCIILYQFKEVTLDTGETKKSRWIGRDSSSCDLNLRFMQPPGGRNYGDRIEGCEMTWVSCFLHFFPHCNSQNGTRTPFRNRSIFSISRNTRWVLSRSDLCSHEMAGIMESWPGRSNLPAGRTRSCAWKMRSTPPRQHLHRRIFELPAVTVALIFNQKKSTVIETTWWIS